jgi:uncharacterized phage protein (TIGR01671 family)
MNNRELKFRIWDKQSKTWLGNGSSLHCYSNWTICPFTSKLVDYVGTFGEDDRCIPSPAEDYYFEGTKLIQEPRYVIQQYTGLKDSKGVEIYEGDVVQYNPNEPNTEREGIIEWSDYYHGWAIRDKQCYPESNYGVYSLASPFMAFNDVKIISHIFENPELIKNNDNNNQ